MSGVSFLTPRYGKFSRDFAVEGCSVLRGLGWSFLVFSWVFRYFHIYIHIFGIYFDYLLGFGGFLGGLGKPKMGI